MSIKSWFRGFIASIDEANMKANYGDNPGQYRPMTETELRSDCLKDDPDVTEEEIQYYIQDHCGDWNEETLLP